MASTDTEDANAYELLGVTLESTEAEIRTAYRQRSLKVHPDRNRGNPDAARKFHELNQAYELLLDPLRRMALDAKMRVKEARKTRFAQYDAKRKNLVEELEERERAFKKARVGKEAETKARMQENERIMEEGRRLREERERELRQKAAEVREAEKTVNADLEPPTLGALDTTVRVKFPLSSHPDLVTPSSLSAFLSHFGTLDEQSIVLSLKPAPPKKPKRVTALVPFKQIGGAFAVICASGRAQSGLADVEVDWAEGKEPDLIRWLKKIGKLSTTGQNGAIPQPTEQDTSNLPPASATPSATAPPRSSGTTPAPTSSSTSTSFSSFPSTFPDLDTPSTAPSVGLDTPGLDYESLTLMRLRQAERERLEREIREREAAEGD
ncbi:DnaJ-domain-containing protein [Obba rivulosa]|uniref:DnaJ-domain-containing protein n=1 Tax=Obba rivulosa TaxID=1052685 RepID=A0A8E2ARF1_9APHY|nr:DnaJ-domain-containing protein [Obba rivulosa]